MRVELQLFAVARQLAGQPSITLELTEPATVAELRRVIAASCPSLAPLIPNLMIAVDAEYANDDDVIHPGAEIAAIPPVSGGAG